MKNLLNYYMTVLLSFGAAVSSSAQGLSSTGQYLDRMTPFEMEVTYEKTSHVIFPAAITYVDLGSEYLTAGKAAGAENVLRIKAAVQDFEPETNFSVITNDGRFYSFDVHYSAKPSSLNYNLRTKQNEEVWQAKTDVLFKELNNSPVSRLKLIMHNICRNDKRILKHISSKSDGIRFMLKGIYIKQGKYYFHTQFSNSTSVPFEIDYVNFKITNKNKTGRTVLQEKFMRPVLIYKPLESIDGNETDQNVFLLEQFTLADDKVLLIEVYEKNGGRCQILKVKNSDLMKARGIVDNTP